MWLWGDGARAGLGLRQNPWSLSCSQQEHEEFNHQHE